MKFFAIKGDKSEKGGVDVEMGGGHALFSLVWNTQKSKWPIFFEYQGKMFLSIEKVLKKKSKDQP